MKYTLLIVCIIVLYSCKPSSKEKIIQNNVIQSLAKYGVDQSPMDMIYLPIDYPKLKLQDGYQENPICRIIYSRPQKNGRIIFGQMVPYNKPWRLGANESTEIEVFQPIIIDKQVVEVGKYTLYCIPTETEWKIVFNKDTLSWGLKFDPSLDYASITVPVEKLDYVQEIFTMEFADEQNEKSLMIAWDHALVNIPIQTL